MSVNFVLFIDLDKYFAFPAFLEKGGERPTFLSKEVYCLKLGYDFFSG